MTTTPAPATASNTLYDVLREHFGLLDIGDGTVPEGYEIVEKQMSAIHDAGYAIVRRSTDADAEARAREALHCAGYTCSPLFGSDPDWKNRGFESVELCEMAVITAAGLRIVDAAADDSRTEALIRHRQFVAALDKLRFDVGPDDVFRYDRVKDLRRALDPYLHDDDTGGEG